MDVSGSSGVGDNDVEYSLWMAIVAWPDERWTGYLVHHFDNGTFASGDEALALADQWAELAYSGQLPWSDGDHPGNVIAAIVDRSVRPQRPLAVYMPKRGPDGFEWPAGRTRFEIVAELQSYERSPETFEPTVDYLWELAEGVANKLSGYADLSWPRWNPRRDSDPDATT